MGRIYVSEVIKAPIDAVWDLIRDFGGWPAWMPSMQGCVLEDGKRGDQVGVLRSLSMADGQSPKSMLVGLSDLDHTIAYRVLMPDGVPLVDYVATIRLRPVTLPGWTFIEWIGEMDVVGADRNATLDAMLQTYYIPWVRDLKRQIEAQPKQQSKP
ncbi:MAG: SRPBCC family protein [Gammaproteobacteria bacterium]